MDIDWGWGHEVKQLTCQCVQILLHSSFICCHCLVLSQFIQLLNRKVYSADELTIVGPVSVLMDLTVGVSCYMDRVCAACY